MARRLLVRINRLTVRTVQTASDGDHSDGGGLLLRVQRGAASWVFRYTAPNGKRREMGLAARLYRDNASAVGDSIVAARKAASEARQLLDAGKDPIVERDREREAQRSAEAAKKIAAKAGNQTLARVARTYHERVIEGNRTDKHAAQWIASLERNVPPELWNLPIADVKAPALLGFLSTLQSRVPETASRVRQRLEAVFDDAEFLGLCTGNPARSIRRKLRESTKGKRHRRGKFAALPYPEAPAFLVTLQAQPGIAARALEFAVLTAARTREVLEAPWSEFDVAAAVWIVPAERMKGGEQHVVPLVPRALEILASMRELDGAVVFPSARDRSRPMSNMAMLTLLRRMGAHGKTTVHGLCRATFSTWAYDTAAARPEVIEACLAHREANLVKAAYNRAQFAAERRALMLAWAHYLAGGATPNNPRG